METKILKEDVELIKVRSNLLSRTIVRLLKRKSMTV
jgi:hypothetical protein